MQIFRILARQIYGTKLIEKLAKDIQSKFPGTEGFSFTNIFRMRAFYIAHSNNPTAVGQLSECPLEIFLNIPWVIIMFCWKNFKTLMIGCSTQKNYMDGAEAYSQFGLKMISIKEKEKQSQTSRLHYQLFSQTQQSKY